MDISLNDYDFILLQESVAMYLDDLRDDLPSSREDVSLAESTSRKLKHYRKASPTLSLADVLVLIAALRGMRDFVVRALDDSTFDDDTRAKILETQRSCNRLIHLFRKELSEELS